MNLVQVLAVPIAFPDTSCSHCGRSFRRPPSPNIYEYNPPMPDIVADAVHRRAPRPTARGPRLRRYTSGTNTGTYTQPASPSGVEGSDNSLYHLHAVGDRVVPLSAADRLNHAYRMSWDATHQRDNVMAWQKPVEFLVAHELKTVAKDFQKSYGKKQKTNLRCCLSMLTAIAKEVLEYSLGSLHNMFKTT